MEDKEKKKRKKKTKKWEQYGSGQNRRVAKEGCGVDMDVDIVQPSVVSLAMSHNWMMRHGCEGSNKKTKKGFLRMGYASKLKNKKEEDDEGYCIGAMIVLLLPQYPRTKATLH